MISVKRLLPKASESFFALVSSRSHECLLSRAYFRYVCAGASNVVVIGSLLSSRFPSAISTFCFFLLLQHDLGQLRIGANPLPLAMLMDVVVDPENPLAS
jgi:hypothetical protein